MIEFLLICIFTIKGTPHVLLYLLIGKGRDVLELTLKKYLVFFYFFFSEE